MSGASVCCWLDIVSQQEGWQEDACHEEEAALASRAARYNIWLLIKLTPKGVVFSFSSFFQHLLTSKIDVVILLQLQLGLASIGDVVYVVLAT